ncbi:MAG TPA: DUF6600 domain-containing protein [Candidatus Cybelea sp.]|nr:DUF6600 domain-containing protein [Candidatus Cybelea sp.]
MNIKNSITKRICTMRTWAAAGVALAVLSAGPVGYAQSPADIARANMEEVVRLTQAKMTDEVLVNFIKTSGKTYSLSSDDLLYLNSRGVSQPVLDAMLLASGGVAPAAAPAPEAPPVAITAPPVTPTIDYFQAHLTPYGQWVDVPGVGAAWVPAEANVPGWRPYMNAGHWQFTDAGWFWQSDYPWGDMAFHYGRWVNNEFTGGRWGWVPGYDWAPSWVSWREGEGGMGWAPLPYGVEFRVGLGLYWHGAVVVEGVDFGLGFDSFVFVGHDHFWGGNYNVYVYDHERSRAFYEHSTFHAGYRMDGGHFVAEGLGREHMAQITHHEVEVHRVAEMRHEEEHHNFEKRTEEHHELVRVVVHPHPAEHPAAGHAPEAHEHVAGAAAERAGGHPGASTERPTTAVAGHPGTPAEHGATTTHTPETHATAPVPTHPGTTPPTGTHPGTPVPNNTHPGAPAAGAKPLAPKPNPPGHTDPPPAGPH